jgi:hypothetical protein
MMPRALGAVLVVAATLAVTLAVAHEERLVRGRVERVDVPGQLLVVEDRERQQSVRVTIDPQTEVLRCRPGAGLAALKPGDRVRVKYLERGRDLDVLSVIVLN